MTSPNVWVVLRSSGVAVVLDITDGRLPAVLHWGADPGELSRADLTELVRSGEAPVAPNVVDEPVRVALLPEHWTGWVGRPGLSGSVGGAAWSPRFTITELRIDGVTVPATPEPELVSTGPAAVAVDAVDRDAELALTLRVELDASGMLRTQAEVINLADGVYQLDDLVLALPVPSVAEELLDFAGRWGKERVPQRRPLTVGVHLREGRKGRTGSDAATVLHLGVPGFGFADGEVWGLHTGWSGNHTHYAERLPTGEQVIGGGELLLPGEVRLAQGESYTSPWVYGSYGVGLDAVARRFHRHLRARPQHPATPRPVTLNVWEAVYFDHDLDQLLTLAERAAEIGVERYVLDDGWFGTRRNDRAGLGDWTVAADVWPDGLHPLIHRVRTLGMQFGLWVEPEMVNPDSALARAHPEWVMATGSRWPVESRHQQVLNLGIEDCYTHIRDALFAILAEYQISYLKWDHNRDLIDAGTQPHGRPGVHAQTRAFYRLIDEIKAAHPGLEIESCSSGGSRVDLGVLERTDRIWVSDCIDPLERQEMNRWTAQLVPLELMGSHIASGVSHTTGRFHELSFRAGSALFGHLGIEWDLTRATEAELGELTAWLGLYRDHRDLLHAGDLVRLDLPDPTLMVTGIVAPDRSRALFWHTSVARSAVVSPGRVRLPGLAAERRYHVAPVLPEFLPGGTRPPHWWGVERVGDELAELRSGEHSRYAVTREDHGVVLTGALLGSVGVMAPLVHPETTVVYLAQSVTAPN